MIFQHFWHHSLNSAFDSHNSHSLEAVSTPNQVKSSIKSSYILFSHMMSHCVSFYYSFSFWFIIWSSCCSKMELSLTHWWAIAYRSQKCCLIVHDSLLYKELSCLRERTIRFRLLLAQLSSGLNSLDYSIRICHHFSSRLDHSIMSIRVCPYYIICFRSALCLREKKFSWEICWI